MNPFIESFQSSDKFGKLIFLFLYGLSIISWVVLIYKTMLIRKSKKLSFKFEELVDKHKYQLLDFSYNNFEKHKSSPFIRIFNVLKETSIESLNKNQFFLKQEDKENKSNFLSESDVQLIESQINAKISKEVHFFEKNLFVLSTIVTLAPFLGLLGTVWGILITFSNMSLQTIGNARTHWRCKTSCYRDEK